MVSRCTQLTACYLFMTFRQALQAAGKSAGNADAVSGKFFLDRAPAVTHLTLAGTQETSSDRDRLWAECERLFGLDAEDAGASAAAASASSARA